MLRHYPLFKMRNSVGLSSLYGRQGR